MKNKFIVYGILSVLSFVGCDKEDDLSWNGERTNWFEIQDKPGRFNQLAYQVYRESGLPIFVNDTIGTEIRGTDAYGEPIIHHEMFVVGYSITSQLGEAGFVLSSDTANMLKAVELIRDRVIPNLPLNYCIVLILFFWWIRCIRLITIGRRILNLGRIICKPRIVTEV